MRYLIVPVALETKAKQEIVLQTRAEFRRSGLARSRASSK